jgi:hypothetical protein
MKSKYGFTTNPQPQPSQSELEKIEKNKKLIDIGKTIDSNVMDVLNDLANSKRTGWSPTSYLEAKWENTGWYGARWFIYIIDSSFSKNYYRGVWRELDIWLDFQNDETAFFVVEMLRGNEHQEQLSLTDSDAYALLTALSAINNYPVKLGPLTAKHVRKISKEVLFPFL